MRYESRAKQAVMSSIWTYSQLISKLGLQHQFFSTMVRYNMTPSRYQEFLETLKRYLDIPFDTEAETKEFFTLVGRRCTAAQFAREKGYPVLFVRGAVFQHQLSYAEYEQIWRDLAQLTGADYDYIATDPYDCRKGDNQ